MENRNYHITVNYSRFNSRYFYFDMAKGQFIEYVNGFSGNQAVIGNFSTMQEVWNWLNTIPTRWNSVEIF